MRIPPDQVPDVFQTHRARTVLIGCASVALAVFVGMIAGFFVGGWIGQRVGVESSGPVILGAFSLAVIATLAALLYPTTASAWGAGRYIVVLKASVQSPKSVAAEHTAAFVPRYPTCTGMP